MCKMPAGASRGRKAERRWATEPSKLRVQMALGPGCGALDGLDLLGGASVRTCMSAVR